MTVVTQPVIKGPDYDVYKLFQHFKGLNLEDSVDNILDVETDDLLNVISDPIGSIRKRRGTQKINTTALNSGKAMTGGIEATFKNGTLLDFFAVQDTVFDKSGSTFTDRTNSQTITDDDDNLMSAEMFLNVVYCAFRKGDGLFKYAESTGLATVTTPNNDAEIVSQWKNRLWVVEKTEPNLLYPGNVDLETFTASNAVNMDSDDGDVIRGIAPYQDEMAVLKRRRIFKLTHTRTVPAFAKREIGQGKGIGCESHQSIIEVENFRGQGISALLFRGQDNYYALVGDNPIPIGNKVKNLIKTFNRDRAQFVSVGIDRDLGFVYWNESTGGSPTHNRTLAYHWVTDSWFLLDYAYNGFTQKVVTGEPQLWGLQYDGFIVQTNIGESDEAIEDQTYSTGGGNKNLGADAAADDYLAQGFKPSVSDDIARVQVKLKIGAGAPTGTVRCHIYSDSGGEPDASLYLSTTDLVVEDKLTAAYTFFEFLFAPDAALTSGTQYHIVLIFDNPSASAYVHWEVDTSGSYASGSVHASGDGSTWVNTAASDFSFKTFMGSEAITSYRTTARLDLGEPHVDRQYARMLIVAESLGNWNVSLFMRRDFDSDYTTLDTLNTGGGATIGGTWVLGTSKLGTFIAVDVWIDLSIVGKRLQLKVENNNANEPYNIFGIYLFTSKIGSWAP